jgi:hypothetical protein
LKVEGTAQVIQRIVAVLGGAARRGLWVTPTVAAIVRVGAAARRDYRLVAMGSNGGES